LEYAFYVILAYVLYTYVKRWYNRLAALWVTGDLNQWVLISRGGYLVKAGIGLNTLVTPFDSVAIFPSKLNKVEISTQ